MRTVGEVLRFKGERDSRVAHGKKLRAGLVGKKCDLHAAFAPYCLGNGLLRLMRRKRKCVVESA